jgi:hypothetical protein
VLPISDPAGTEKFATLELHKVSETVLSGDILRGIEFGRALLSEIRHLGAGHHE